MLASTLLVSMLTLLPSQTLAKNGQLRPNTNGIYISDKWQHVTEDQLVEWQQYYNVEIKDSELLPLINSPLNKETQEEGENQSARKSPYTELTHEDRLWTFAFLGFIIHPPFENVGEIYSDFTLTKNTALFLLVQGHLEKFDMYISHDGRDNLMSDPQVFELSALKYPFRYWRFTSTRLSYEADVAYTEMTFGLCSPKDFFRSVPTKYLTDAMIDKILDEQPDAVQWLVLSHASMLTRERALKLVERANPPQGSTNTRFTLSIADYLPEALLNDQSFWKQTFKRNRKYFWRFPDKYKTLPMSLSMVRDNPWNLRLVPPKKRHASIWAIATRVEPHLKDQIKRKHRTKIMQYEFFKYHTPLLLEGKANLTDKMLSKCILSIERFIYSCASSGGKFSAAQYADLLRPFTLLPNSRYPTAVEMAWETLDFLSIYTEQERARVLAQNA